MTAMTAAAPPGCSLAAPLAPLEQLNARGLELRLDSQHWPLQPDFLARSPVVQKLARADGERDGRYVLEPRLRDLREQLVVASHWPGDPAGFEAWWNACDCLLLQPRPQELAFAIIAALRPWNLEAAAVLRDCSSPRALQHTRRARQAWTPLPLAGELEASGGGYGYGDELEAVAASSGLATDSGSLGWHEPPTPAPDSTCRDPAPPPLLRSLGATELAERALACQAPLRLLGVCCQQALQAAGAVPLMANTAPQPPAELERGLFCQAPCVLHGAVATLMQTLVGLTNTARGSRHVLSLVPELCTTFGTAVAQRLVHRCFCSLYLAESLQQWELCALPLPLVHRLQALYRDGGGGGPEALGLLCFLPMSCLELRPRLHLLPGQRLAGEVAPLLEDEEQLLRELAALVPWLPVALAGPVRLHLSGSLLCWARSRARAQPEPSDADLFCENLDELEAAQEQLSAALMAYARERVGTLCTLLEVQRPNERRRVLELQGQGVEAWPPYLRRCDLYVNTVSRVASYHLPQMRAAFSLAPDGRPRLYLCASAAVAWITMVNVDYCAFKGSKTPAHIIARGWLWGFNICLSAKEAAIMSSYLFLKHRQQYQRALRLSRKQWLQPQPLVRFHMCTSFDL